MINTVLITGGTGLVGSRITKMLLEEGYEVAHLSRSAKGDEKVKTYTWDIKKQQIDIEAIRWADAIIHLAGAGVADKRWTAEQKEIILKSRTESSKLLYNTLRKENKKLVAFVSASAIGYYGTDTGELPLTEKSAKGAGFLAEVVDAWEMEVAKIQELDIPTAMLRIGVVLSANGGALKKMMEPMKLGAGAPLGSGKQIMSWIHVDDLAALFIFALENQLKGVFNAVGPHSARNEELTKLLAKVMNKPLLLPSVPKFALKLMLGEMAQVVLGSNYVSSEKIQSSGFNYQYPELYPALEHLITQKI